MQRYIDQDFRANPAFAVGQGRHEYDGRLPDWSETGLAQREGAAAQRDRRRLGLQSAAADRASSGSSATI